MIPTERDSIMTTETMTQEQWEDHYERSHERTPTWWCNSANRLAAYERWLQDHNDVTEDRPGEWMHTASGRRFFVQDPRPEDICIDDIANGLALDCRYGGQGRVDKFYSVAEHSTIMSRFARTVHTKPAFVCMAVLLHDAPEAYINDLCRSVKHAVGEPYKALETNISFVILKKYGVLETSVHYAAYIKSLDQRIVPHEKAAIMAIQQPWAYDKFDPLPGVEIKCLSPVAAKIAFLEEFQILKTLMKPEWG